MQPRDFVYWLQGFLELSEATILSEAQVSTIKDHIQLVLKKETPARFQPLLLKEVLDKTAKEIEAQKAFLRGGVVDVPTVLSC